MKIGEVLKQEIAKSEKFTSENFGLKIGSSYPELVRECIAEKEVQITLMKSFLLQHLTGPGVVQRLKGRDISSLTSQPEVYDSAMSMLYWGIEIGRKLAVDEAQALKAIHE